MDFIFELEKERGQEGYFKFVLFEGTDGMWRVRAREPHGGLLRAAPEAAS